MKNKLLGRFQERTPDSEWLLGHYESELVHLENIKKVPIANFVGTEDNICPHATALKYIPQIGSETVTIDVNGKDHFYFGNANDDWFMENLVA